MMVKLDDNLVVDVETKGKGGNSHEVNRLLSYYHYCVRQAQNKGMFPKTTEEQIKWGEAAKIHEKNLRIWLQTGVCKIEMSDIEFVKRTQK